MSKPPLPAWQDRASDARFAEPGACEHRATRFERTIRRRNAVEYLAGALVIALFGSGALGAAAAGLWDFAGACALVLIGTLFVLWTLHRAGSYRGRRPEQSCREHLRNQLLRQRDLLRRVPLWYLAPLLPGVLGIYGATAIRVAAKAGWGEALGGIWMPLAGTAAFFAFVAWLNLAAARRLEAEIAQIEGVG